jgi:hypothetical protein
MLLMRVETWMIVLLLGMGSVAGFAQEQDENDEQQAPIEDIPRWPNMYLEYPLVDLPFNSDHGGRFPSMSQSLALTKDVAYLTHFGLESFLRPRAGGARGFFSRVGVFAFDSMMMTVPLGNAWLHEEWHRAVMSHRGIDSHNGVYDAKSSDSVIPVDQVTDEDLAMLKNEYPAEHVRLSSAGMESEHALALSMQQDHFFRDATTYDSGSIWLAKIGPAGYLDACAGSENISSTEEMNQIEVTIKERDFTGLDCNAWAYDVFRPEEDYSARGVHPTGVGIDRYRTTEHLKPNEMRYLELQARLSLLNFVDLNLFVSPNQLMSYGDWKWSAGLAHDLTSFGHVVDVNTFLRRGTEKYQISLHNYFTYKRYLPGIEVRQFSLMWRGYEVDWRLMAWMQPKEQIATTGQSQFGGLVGGRVLMPSWLNSKSYVELEGKSEGWVQGVVALEPAVAGRVGVEWML